MSTPIYVLLDGAGSDWLELLGAAEGLATGPITALSCDPAVADACRGRVDQVVALPAFPDGVFDGEHLAAAVVAWLAQQAGGLVLMAHGNLAMDCVGALSVGADLPVVTDGLGIEASADGWHVLRSLHGGKARALVGAPRCALVTLRPGSCAASTRPPDPSGELIHFEAQLPPLRRRMVETVAADTAGVDISQATRLVAVGRGIEDQDNLELIRSLADALGAELACTRPIVDLGWLEKSRQVGTSGQTVSPQVYLAVGVSGSFQHLGGIKGSPLMIAINQDPAAPIFERADVGVIGDLFDLVPLLDQKLREA